MGTAAMDRRPNLKNYAPDALRERFRRAGLEPYRADQVSGWLYKRDVADPAAMTDLSLAVRERLAAEWRFHALDLAELRQSRDGTRKALLRADDGALVESVLIPEERRNTLCLSTQVGCSLACAFCATGAMGLVRNLSTAEIVDQVCRMRELLGPDEEITNVVFMGMGEPLLNFSALLEALRILVHPRAFAMAHRRITVSTVGVIPKLHPLLEFGPVNLAVSLHAANDDLRDKLVPLNRQFPLADLLQALRTDPLVTARRPIFFEYTLIDGVNDSPEQARQLARLLRGLPCKLNVIPMNPHVDCDYRRPAPATLERFTAALHAAGVRVTTRRSRGTDIDAACGQLALRGSATSRMARRRIKLPVRAAEAVSGGG